MEAQKKKMINICRVRSLKIVNIVTIVPTYALMRNTAYISREYMTFVNVELYFTCKIYNLPAISLYNGLYILLLSEDSKSYFLNLKMLFDLSGIIIC